MKIDKTYFVGAKKTDQITGLHIAIDPSLALDFKTLAEKADQALFKTLLKAGLDTDIYPIEIDLPCGCYWVVNDASELKTKQCHHKNYFVRIVILEEPRVSA